MSDQELIVIKHGTSTVCNDNGIGLDRSKISSHIQQHVLLRQAGFETVEVASGAAAAGKEYLVEMGEDPEDRYVHAEWAVYGTARQARHWEEAARPHGLIVGQALITHEQMQDTYNSGERLSPGALIAWAVRNMTWDKSLVVVNENNAADVYEMNELIESEEEESQGEGNPESDNDWLAAYLARLVGASTLLLLCNKDGFEVEGRVMPEVRTVDIPDLLTHCVEPVVDLPELFAQYVEPSILGTGGMRSKLRAAGWAANAGIKVIIGNAFTDYRQLLAGESGTRVVE